MAGIRLSVRQSVRLSLGNEEFWDFTANFTENFTEISHFLELAVNFLELRFLPQALVT